LYVPWTEGVLSIGSQGFILPTGVSQIEVEQTSDNFIAAVVKKVKRRQLFGGRDHCVQNYDDSIAIV